MSTRNPQRRAPNPVKNGKVTTSAPARPQANGTSDVQPRTSGAYRATGVRNPNLPIEGHRLLATVALVAMLLLSLLPLPVAAAPDASTLITPDANGTGSIPRGIALGSGDAFDAIFPYRTLAERSGENIASVWPEAGDVLSFDPSSLRVRRALIGQLFASSSGSLNIKIKDSGLAAIPDADALSTIESTYNQLMSTEDKAAQGINGLASLELVRSLSDTPQNLAKHERTALFGFGQTLSANQQRWEYTHNWSLANLLMGNYAAAYEGFNGIKFGAQKDSNIWPFFWVGVSALRGGNPGEAINAFRDAINISAPADATEGVKGQYAQVHDLSREGMADAQWANRNPVEAYGTYLDLLQLGTASAGVYNKWLRLGMEQQAYGTLLNDMKAIYESDPNGSLVARIHHDRARLLSLLGRTGEALDEYRLAAGIAQGDPRLIVSYAQALEASGDHDNALGQAQLAISKLGKDPLVADLTSVASAVTTSTTTYEANTAAQQLLDANLVRARAWGRGGHSDLADRLAGQIKGEAAGQPPPQAGMLNLYSGYAYEAAGDNNKARDSYRDAWNILKGLPAGQAGRAASLAGWARMEGATAGAARGVDILKQNGYDPAAPKPSVGADPDASDILTQGSILLAGAGKQKESANALRVAAIVRNVRDARQMSGVGRPLWAANGTLVPASGMLAVGDALSSAGDKSGLTGLRYREAYGLQPALAPAFSNLGVLYNEQGNKDLAKFYLQSASTISPSYIRGQQNPAAFSYKQGPGGFLAGEAAQARVIKSVGPSVASWGYSLAPDLGGNLPAPLAPPSDDPLRRIPAIALIALLLAHTLVRNDRKRFDEVKKKTILVPGRGVLGTPAQALNNSIRSTSPRLVAARSGVAGALTAIAVPTLVGMLALAWHGGRGSLDASLAYLPVALLAAFLAFAANELVQQIAARRMRGATLHHTSPFGVLLGIVTVPFGFMYGWGATTRVQSASGARPLAGKNAGPRNTTNVQEAALAREAEFEAEADDALMVPVDGVGAASLSPAGSGTIGRLGLNTAASVMFAGLLANVALALVFGVIYLLTGWTSLRLAMLASVLVLAFTAVCDPPADGWTLYRRNPALWLGVFVLGALASVMLVAGVM